MGDDTGVGHFRDVFIAGLAAVPEAGAFLALFATMLWPAEGSNPLDTFMEKSKELAHQVEDDAEITNLNNILTDMRSELEHAQHKYSEGERKQVAMNLWDLSGRKYDQFVKSASDQPQRTVPLLVVYGTIRLAVMVEYVQNYKYWFGSDPTPIDGPVTDLRREIQELSAKVATDRAGALAWRQQQIQESMEKGVDAEFPMTEWRWTVTDAVNPNSNRLFKGTNTPSDDEVTSVVESKKDQYVVNLRFNESQAQGGYASTLDDTLDAARFWKYADPSNRLVPTPGSRYWCTVIGGCLTANRTYFNDEALYMQHGDITQLLYWRDDGALKGIQCFYGGVAGTVHGTPAGTATVTIPVSDADSDGITMVAWSAGDWVSKFAAGSNSQGFTKFPGLPGFDVSSGLAARQSFPQKATLTNGDPRLAYISGFQNGNEFIGQLRLVWKTGETYTTDLPLEHSVIAASAGPITGNFPAMSWPYQPMWCACTKCATLTYGTRFQRCASGALHDYSTSGNYSLMLGGSNGEGHWKWCKRCGVLSQTGKDGTATPGPCPFGDTHDLSESGEYVVATDESLSSNSAAQKLWRLCCKCKGLNHTSVNGVCQVGGGLHDNTGSGTYLVFFDSSNTGGQKGWRWCSKCSLLGYVGGVRCPAGDTHTCNTDVPFQVAHPDSGADVTDYGQNGWGWCQKCDGMVFKTDKDKSCGAGGGHDFGGSGDYTIRTHNGGSLDQGWRWCNKCGSLWNNRSDTYKSVCPNDKGAHTSDGSAKYYLTPGPY